MANPLDELRVYLSSGVSAIKLYDQEEISELTLSVYNILRWALRDSADTIVIFPTQVVWQNSSAQLGNFEFFNADFRPYFELVRRKDTIIGTHVVLTSANTDMAIYKIV